MIYNGVKYNKYNGDIFIIISFKKVKTLNNEKEQINKLLQFKSDNNKIYEL